MNRHDRHKRRAVIVRRWAAYRTGRAQREIWRRRREAQGVDPDEIVGEVGEDDLLAGLPDGLIG